MGFLLSIQERMHLPNWSQAQTVLCGDFQGFCAGTFIVLHMWVGVTPCRKKQ